MTGSGRRRGIRGRLLIVDDEASFGSAIQRVLIAENDVTLVKSARDALEVIARGATFDVILCDVMMLHMTGVEFVERLMTTNAEQASRVVLVVGGVYPAPVRERLARLPNPRVARPIDLVGLRTFVRRRVYAPYLEGARPAHGPVQRSGTYAMRPRVLLVGASGDVAARSREHLESLGMEVVVEAAEADVAVRVMGSARADLDALVAEIERALRAAAPRRRRGEAP